MMSESKTVPWLHIKGLVKRWPMKTVEIDFSLEKGEIPCHSR